ncbi:carnitine O-palmitoyltransferase 2, mitochondrial [Aricia agestis]|uniref:carnitine O-palmitoyltransferase 2, mitochondrial n=1 Tax=Aricia agestis TaxID=91739 RepID=UPI001C20B31A|nr:carnitine O-palmitoyltransferase 2, mitochondrial [Aricia agestis]XP_041988037.1 carnitine O-palmitoyltransferase 2, mitochondrial [Aricia agestis]
MLTIQTLKICDGIVLKKSNFHRNFSKKVKNVKDFNYQYLQKSKVPTMHFQKSLPRLPIPELSKSKDRFLNAVRPLMNSDEYAKTIQIVNSFADKEGKTLQETLIAKDKANKHTSYISDYWFDLYLRDRVALPINYNPLLVVQNDTRPEYNNQLLRASNLLVTSLRFMLSLRAQLLIPEVYHLNPKKSNTPSFWNVTGFLPESLSWYGAYLFKAFPLDMSQFPGLFNASRIPKINKDVIFRDPKSNHILIQKNGNFYVFDVLDSDGNLLAPTEILGNMAKIMNDNSPKAEFPLGVLTCQNRNEWAKQRAHLEETGNAEALKLIDSAIFNLVLDDETMGDDKHKLLKHYLHGDGANRWFDKSISLIVTKDGVSGVNFEHSWGDGVAVLRYIEDIYAETVKKPFLTPECKPSDKNISVKKMEFKLDDKAKHFVQKATKEYSDFYNSLSIDYILYEGLNKDRIKKFKVSGDCIMQLGFQAAYHLLYGKYVGTYESCSTSAFKHGRTETMRPCTDKTKAFCDGLHTKSKAELRALMQECTTYHSMLVKEAAMGQGFDRHLFALMKIAEDHNLPRPELFDSYAYKYLNKSILSTSTLSSPNMMGGGFGPVTKEGFGIAYSVFPDKVGAAVISYKDHNNSTHFVEALNKIFVDITNLLSGE